MYEVNKAKQSVSASHNITSLGQISTSHDQSFVQILSDSNSKSPIQLMEFDRRLLAATIIVIKLTIIADVASVSFGTFSGTFVVPSIVNRQTLRLHRKASWWNDIRFNLCGHKLRELFSRYSFWTEHRLKSRFGLACSPITDDILWSTDLVLLSEIRWVHTMEPPVNVIMHHSRWKVESDSIHDTFSFSCITTK